MSDNQPSNKTRPPDGHRREASSEVTESLDLALEASRRKNAALEAENEKRLELAAEQERELINANKGLRIMKSTAPSGPTMAQAGETEQASVTSEQSAAAVKWKSAAIQSGWGAVVAVVNMALISNGFTEMPTETADWLQGIVTQYVVGQGGPTLYNNFVMKW